MDSWITVWTFMYPHEAHIPKAKLESEGIEVFIKDELTAQVNNIYSNAIGGVKLQVREKDYQRAVQILEDAGYVRIQDQKENKFVTRLEKYTARIPFIGKLILEFRLLIIIAVLLFVIIMPFAILSLPNLAEKLTWNSWCIDHIYFKNKEVFPNTYDHLELNTFSDCDEYMIFYQDGSAYLPGFGTDRFRAYWSIEGKILKIGQIAISEEFGIYSKKDTTQNTFITDTQGKIYSGNYRIKVRKNFIVLRSDKLVIYGIRDRKK